MRNEHIKWFTQAASWNAAESLFYQLALNTHLIVLYNIAGKQISGSIGLCFCIIYLCAAMINAGFDQWLPASISALTQKRFIKILGNQSTLAVSLLVLIAPFIIGIYLHKLHLGLASALLITLCVFFEQLRKTLRQIAQLLFLQRYAALIELLNLLFYLTLFWGSWHLYGTVQLTTALVPLATQSVVGTLLLGTIIWRSLPESSECDIPHFTSKRRLEIVSAQLSRLLFSSNALIAFLGVLYSMQTIAILKLTSSMTLFIGILIEHVIGAPLVALQAIKPAQTTTLFLRLVVRYTLAALIAGGIIAWSNQSIMQQLCGIPNAHEFQAAMLFILMISIDHLCAVLEKLAVLTKHLPALVQQNMGAALAWALLVATTFLVPLPLSLLLGLFLLIRIGVLILHLRTLQLAETINTKFTLNSAFCLFIFVGIALLLTIYAVHNLICG